MYSNAIRPSGLLRKYGTASVNSHNSLIGVRRPAGALGYAGRGTGFRRAVRAAS